MNVGFIGLGNMGAPLARRLLGHVSLTVYDLSAERVGESVQAGATAADSPGALAAGVQLSGKMFQGFTTALMLKDSGVALDIAASHDLEMPLGSRARELLESTIAQYGKDADMSAVALTYEQLTGARMPPLKGASEICSMPHHDTERTAAVRQLAEAPSHHQETPWPI